MVVLLEKVVEDKQVPLFLLNYFLTQVKERLGEIN